MNKKILLGLLMMVLVVGSVSGGFSINKGFFGTIVETEFSYQQILDAKIVYQEESFSFGEGPKSQQQPYYKITIKENGKDVPYTIIPADDGQYYVAEGHEPNADTEFCEMTVKKLRDDIEVTEENNFGLANKLAGIEPQIKTDKIFFERNALNKQWEFSENQLQNIDIDGESSYTSADEDGQLIKIRYYKATLPGDVKVSIVEKDDKYYVTEGHEPNADSLYYSMAKGGGYYSSDVEITKTNHYGVTPKIDNYNEAKKSETQKDKEAKSEDSVEENRASYFQRQSTEAQNAILSSGMDEKQFNELMKKEEVEDVKAKKQNILRQRKLISLVNNKFLYFDKEDKPHLVSSDKKEAAQAEVDKINKALLEEAVNKNTGYNSLGFSAANKDSTNLVVQDKNGDFYIASIMHAGIVTYTPEKEPTISADETWGDKLISVTYSLKKGEDPKITHIKGVSVVGDTALQNEIKKALKDSDSSIDSSALNSNILRVVDKNGNYVIDTQTTNKERITKRYFKDSKLVREEQIQKVYEDKGKTITIKVTTNKLLYFDENKNVVSGVEYAIMSKEEQDKVTQEAYPDVVTDNTQGEFTRYNYKYGVEDDKIVFSEAYVYDSKTMELKEYIYNDLNVAKAYRYDYKTKKWDKTPSENAKTAQADANRRRVVQGIRMALTEFRGLGYYSKFFYDKEELKEWRESVDEFFANTFLGTKYWVSEVCSHQYDKTPEGTAYVSTPEGMVTAAAHVEARLSSTTTDPDGNTLYLYKISAYIKPPNEDVEFNILLGSENVAGPVNVAGGSSYSAAGDSVIVKYFSSKQDSVCINFIDRGEFSGDVCNSVK